MVRCAVVEWKRRLASVNRCYREQFVVVVAFNMGGMLKLLNGGMSRSNGIFVRIDFGRDPLVNIDRLEMWTRGVWHSNHRDSEAATISHWIWVPLYYNHYHSLKHLVS